MSDASTQAIGKRVVGTTLMTLHAGPSFHTEIVTQVTNGVPLDVLKLEGEWAHVRQLDGYLGWAFAPYLVEFAAPAPAVTHFVSALDAPLYASNDAASTPVARLAMGTGVAIGETRGEWTHITPVGGKVPGGWTTLDALRAVASLPLSPEAARKQIVADARRLTGVQYVWGGCSASGIDCSGLAQLCHRLAGYVLLRDASLQYPVGKIVEGPFQPGDLVYFHGETNKERITHVGISTGGMGLIHSSRRRNGVYEEDMALESLTSLRVRIVGARTFLV